MANTLVLAILLAITTYGVRSTGFGMNILPSASISLKKGGEIGLKIGTPRIFGKSKSFEVGVGGNIHGSIGINDRDAENENRAASGQEQNHVEHSSGGETNVNKYENNDEYKKQYTSAGVNVQKQEKQAATSGSPNFISATTNKLLSFGSSVWNRGKSVLGIGQTKSSVEATSEHTPENNDVIDNKHITSYEVHYSGQGDIGNQLERDMGVINGNIQTSSGSYSAGVPANIGRGLAGALGGNEFDIEGKKQLSFGDGTWTHGTSRTDAGQALSLAQATNGHTPENNDDILNKHIQRYEVHYSGQGDIRNHLERDMGVINGNIPTSSGSYSAGVPANIGGNLAGALGGNEFDIEGKKQLSFGGGTWTHGTSRTDARQTLSLAQATNGHTPENNNDILNKHIQRYEVHYSGQGDIRNHLERDMGVINGNIPTSSGSYSAGVPANIGGGLAGALGSNGFGMEGKKQLFFGGSTWTHGTSGADAGQTQSSAEATIGHTPENNDNFVNKHTQRYEVHYSGQGDIGNHLEHDMGVIDGKKLTSSGSYGAGVTANIGGGLAGALGSNGFGMEGKKQLFFGGSTWTHGTSGADAGQTQSSAEATIGHTPENNDNFVNKHTQRYEVHYSGQGDIGNQLEHDKSVIDGKKPTSSGSYGAGVTANIGGGLAGALGGNKFGMEGKKQLFFGGSTWTHGTSGADAGQALGLAQATNGHTPENNDNFVNKHTQRYEVHYSGQGDIGNQLEHDMGVIDGKKLTSSGSYGAGVTANIGGSLAGALGDHGFSIGGKKQLSFGGSTRTHGTSGIDAGQTQSTAEATIGHTPENNDNFVNKHTQRYEVHYSGQGDIGNQLEHDMGVIDGKKLTSSGSYGAGVTANIGGGLAGALGGNKFGMEGKKQLFFGGSTWTHGTSGADAGQALGLAQATNGHTPENNDDILNEHTQRYEVHYSGQGDIGNQLEHDMGVIDGKKLTSSGSYGAGVTANIGGSLAGALGDHGFSIEGKKQLSFGGSTRTHGTSGTDAGQTQSTAEATIGHTPENNDNFVNKHTQRYEVHYSGQGDIGNQLEHDKSVIDGKKPTSSGSYGAGVTANIGGSLAGALGDHGFSIEGKKQLSFGGGTRTHGTSGIDAGQTQSTAEGTIGHTPENNDNFVNKHTQRYEVHYSGQGDIGNQLEHDKSVIDGKKPTSSGSYGAGVTSNIGGSLAGALGDHGFSIEGKKQLSFGGGTRTHGTSGIDAGQTQSTAEGTIGHTPENNDNFVNKHTQRYEVHYSGQGDIGNQLEHDKSVIDGKKPTSSGSYGAGVTSNIGGSLAGALGDHGFSIESKKQLSFGGSTQTHGTSGTDAGQTQSTAEATNGHTPVNNDNFVNKHTQRYEVHYSGQGDIGNQLEHDKSVIDGKKPTSSGSYGAGVTSNIGGSLAGALGDHGFSIESKKQLSFGGSTQTHVTSGTDAGQTQSTAEATNGHTPVNNDNFVNKHTQRYEVHYSGQGDIGNQLEHDMGVIDGKKLTSLGSYGAGVTANIGGSLAGALGDHGFSIEGKKQLSFGGGTRTHGTSGIDAGQTQSTAEGTIGHTPENNDNFVNKHTQRYEVHYSGQGDIGNQLEHDKSVIDGKKPTSSGSYGAGVTSNIGGSLAGALGDHGFSIEGKKQLSFGGGTRTHGTSGIDAGQTQSTAEGTIGHTPENNDNFVNKHTQRYEVHYSGQGDIGNQLEHDKSVIDGKKPTSSGSYGAGVTSNIGGSLAGALGDHGFSIESKKQLSFGGSTQTHGTSGTDAGQTQSTAEATNGHTPVNNDNFVNKHTQRYEVHYSGQGDIGNQLEHDKSVIDGKKPTSSGSYGAGVTANIGGGLAGALGGNKFGMEGKKQLFFGGSTWTHGTSGADAGQALGLAQATNGHTPENNDNFVNKHTQRYEVHYSGQGDIGNQLEHDMGVIDGKKLTSLGSYGAGVTANIGGSLAGALGDHGLSIEGKKQLSFGGSTRTHGTSGTDAGQTQNSVEATNGHISENDLASSGGSGAGASLDNENKVVWGISDHVININDKKQVSSTADKSDQISGMEVQHSGFGQIQKHEHGRIEVGTGGDIERSFEAKIYRNENGHSGCVTGHHQGQMEDHSRYHAKIGYGIGIPTTNDWYSQIPNQGKINSEQEHGYVKNITLSSGDQNENQRVRQSQDAAHHGGSFEFHSEKQGGVGSHQGEHNDGYYVVYVEHRGQDGSRTGVWRESDSATGSNVEIEGKHIGRLETQKHGGSDPRFILMNYLNKPGVLVYEQNTNTDNLISGQRVFNVRPSLSGTDNKLNWEIESSKSINHGSNGESRHFSEHRYGYHRGDKVEHQSKSEVKHFSTSATSSGPGGFSVESSASHTTSNDEGSALHTQSNPTGNSLHGQSSAELSGSGLLDVRMEA